MKKIISAVLIMVLLYSCGSSDQQAAQVTQPLKSKQSRHNDEFNHSFGGLLAAYFELKDAFVKTDSALVSNAASALVNAADSLQWGDLKDSTTLFETARTFVRSIRTDAASMLMEKNLEENRKTFSTISENLYPLIQTVRYDRQIVYHQFCPMAFNDAGAYWMSNVPEIKNPYFGDKMLTCGEVRDSLAY